MTRIGRAGTHSSRAVSHRIQPVQESLQISNIELTKDSNFQNSCLLVTLSSPRSNGLRRSPQYG